MHGADDICLAQELVRDELPRPNSDSERDAAVGDCRSFGQAPEVANFPFRRFCFQWVPLRSDPGVGDVEVLQKRQHQDCVAHGVTVVHVPLVRQAHVSPQRVPRVMSTSELFWPTKQEICQFLQSGRVVRLESFTPIQGRVPAACCAAVLPRVSAATMPGARLHSRVPSISPCSAPRSFGIGERPSYSTKDRFR